MNLYYRDTPVNGNTGVWSDFSDLQNRMNRLLRGRGEESDFPGVNVYADDEEIIVTAEIPGVNPEDIDISLEDDVLTMKFSREAITLEEGEKSLRRERPTGKFSRNVYLPYRGEGDRVEANFKNGVLEVKIPRAEADKPRKISVITDK